MRRYHMMTSRTGFTSQQRSELWERWKGGQCVADIARAFERSRCRPRHAIISRDDLSKSLYSDMRRTEERGESIRCAEVTTGDKCGEVAYQLRPSQNRRV